MIADNVDILDIKGPRKGGGAEPFFDGELELTLEVAHVDLGLGLCPIVADSRALAWRTCAAVSFDVVVAYSTAVPVASSMTTLPPVGAEQHSLAGY